VTPEGKVKAKIRKLLNNYGAYYFQPVQMGIGATGLDFHCMLAGARAFFVEAKAPGKQPTLRQQLMIEKLTYMGATVFVIDDDVTLEELKDWLDEHSHAAVANL
jgi:hypothetical protein